MKFFAARKLVVVVNPLFSVVFDGSRIALKTTMCGVAIEPLAQGDIVSKLLKLSLLCVAALACTAVPAFAGRSITVPEPASILLLASGIGSVVVLRRVRK